MYRDPNQIEDFFGLKPNGKEPKKKSFKDILDDKAGWRAKIRLLPKILSFKERYLIFVFILVVLGSVISIPFTTFYHYTHSAADFGGSFSEGVIGEPRHINPLLSQTNDADRDLASLIYSGLLKYNEQGKLIPDLAKSYEISSDGLTFTIYLKENVTWHDRQPVTAEDVIFTIHTAQNPDYGSLQRINWQGVTVEKVNDTTVRFILKNKYAQFLSNLTLGIMPKHVWQDVKPINFSLSDSNLKPVGSGSFMFKKYRKDVLGRIRAYELKSNEYYYDSKPYIDTIELKFYDTEEEMISDFNRNNIQSIGSISPKNIKKIKFKQRLTIQEIRMPRYFAVFFNPGQNKILENKNVRLALSHATDKQQIINTILSGYGTPVNSPLIDGVLDINADVKKYPFDSEQAKKILAADGWVPLRQPADGGPDEKGVLQKNKQRLSIKITTSTWPELAEVANILKEQWAKVGVEVVTEALPTGQLQQAIKERDYQALLFGEILTVDPDPFSLWHSSQKKDPGLNLALYDNKTADRLLEEARQTLNPLERMKKYDDFQKLMIDDAPAIFLYNPKFLYGQSKEIKGFDRNLISMPSDRFSGVEKWYIETERVRNK